MKIINNTDYVTNDLKKIFTQCEKTNGIVCDAWIMKNLTVKIVHTKQARGCSGRAAINGYSMTIRIPNYEYYFLKADNISKVYSIDGKMETKLYYLKRKRRNLAYDVAWIFCHELQHIRGLYHKDIQDAYELEWTKDFIIGIKIKKDKPKVNLQIKRYENVMKHVKETESKIKRWQKILKKWNVKKKYYEKILTAEGMRKE